VLAATGLMSAAPVCRRGVPRASRSCSILLIRLIVQNSRPGQPLRKPAQRRRQTMATGDA
jgi:hypothetical protein